MNSNTDQLISIELLERLRRVHQKHVDKMQENTRPLVLLKLYEELGELHRAKMFSEEMEEATDLLFMTFAYMFEINSENIDIIDYLQNKLEVIEQRVGILT